MAEVLLLGVDDMAANLVHGAVVGTQVLLMPRLETPQVLREILPVVSAVHAILQDADGKSTPVSPVFVVRRCLLKLGNALWCRRGRGAAAAANVSKDGAVHGREVPVSSGLLELPSLFRC